MDDPLHDWIDDLPRPLAFVMGGGASLGAVQVGMLRALIHRGLRPDFLVGTSVGAINAAYMAADFGDAQLGRLERIWHSITTDDVFHGVGVRSVFRFLAPGSSDNIASPEGLEKLFDNYLPATHEELPMRMAAVGTNLRRGTKVTLEGGDLRRNVLASASIPGIFPPVEIDGELMVDGGVVANVPVLPARQMGAETLVVLDPGYPCALDEVPSSRIGYAMHIITLMLRQQSFGVLHFLGDDATVLYPPPPCPMDVPPHDFSRTRELVAQGEETAAEFLEGLEVTEPGVYGHPHFHADGESFHPATRKA